MKPWAGRARHASRTGRVGYVVAVAFRGMNAQRRGVGDGIGITAQELTPGTAVMVPVGEIAAAVNGGPCIIAWAVVRGPASETDAAVFVDPSAMYWLDVYMVPGGPPLPQMYRADAILGVPALGLHMDGAPAPSYVLDAE